MTKTGSPKAVQTILDAKGERIAALMFANSQPRVATYLAIAEAVNRAGHLGVVVHPRAVTVKKEELRSYAGVAVLPIRGTADLRSLSGVDVFFSAEVVHDAAPQGATTVALFHSVPESLDYDYASAFSRDPRIIRTFDYLMVSLKQERKNWTKANYDRLVGGVYPPEMMSDRRPVIDIVPAGYPKLDYLKRVIGQAETLDTIVYSPTRRTLGVGQMDTHGRGIVSALLEAFPSHRIVFRPYPFPEDIEIARSIAAEFATDPRFSLDESLTGVAELSRAAFVVTDQSSSAVSFSMAVGRPVIFSALSDDRPAEPAVKLANGFQVHSLDDLVSSGRECLDRQGWARSISALKKARLYNPDSASEYIASHLEDFAARRTAKGWLSVPRRPWLAPADPERRKADLATLASRLRIHRRKEAAIALAEIEAWASEDH